MAEFRLEGFDELEAELKGLGRDAEKVLRAGVRAGAVRLRKAAQANLEPHRDSGQLSESLKVSTRINRSKRSVVAKVRNTNETFYGMFLEFGTIHQQPHKWFTRAFRDNHREILNVDVAGRMRKRIAAIKVKRAKK